MNQVIEVLHQFGVDWPKFIATTVNFCIVLWILHRFAYKPLLQTLEERRQKIQESLTNAEKIKEELAKAEATRREIIQKANDQANRFIADAQKSAAIQGEKRLQEAIVQAESVIKKAHEATVLERDKMMAELKREVGRLVVATTTKVTGKVLTADDQKRLNEEATRQIAA